jgi:hypothetical protein
VRVDQSGARDALAPDLMNFQQGNVPMTLREQYCAALAARGETVVKRTAKFIVYTAETIRPGAGKFIYVGASGALRIGKKVTESFALSEAFKAKLLSQSKGE